MKAFLQSADLSAHEFEADVHMALGKLETHDWAAEERTRATLEEQGMENCPAGLGLTRDDGHILHVCPSGESALVYYHRPKRVFGFLWSRQQILTRPDLPMARVPTLVRHFFEGNDDLLERSV